MVDARESVPSTVGRPPLHVDDVYALLPRRVRGWRSHARQIHQRAEQ